SADADPSLSAVTDGSGADAAASIVLGNVALTRHEFHVMLQRMQTEVPQHDVKFGILGTFRGLISGETLAGWWCINYPTVVRGEADALSVGQSMLDQGYLRFMGRGSQFQSRANAYYQWKRPALEFQSDDDGTGERDSDDEPLMGRRASYERAQREADAAAAAYRESVAQGELVRTGLEEQLTNYLDTMEVWELNRLMSLKSMLGEYARISKRPVETQLAISDRLEVYEESIKPQQDIQWGIENYGTGRFAPRPVVFQPFGRSAAEFQVFGVPLDEQLLVSHKAIPLLPAKALSLIRKAARDMAPEDRFQIWTTRVLLSRIHELRNTINRGPRVTLRQLRAFDPPVVANALLLYLLELPAPLCPEELHGPLRAVYSSRSEKGGDETLRTLRTLLEGISYAHLATMQALFGGLRELAGVDESPARAEFVRAAAKRLGPVVVRGIDIIGAGASRIPESFAADLIEHYDVVLAGIATTRPLPPATPPTKTEGDTAAADPCVAEPSTAATVVEPAEALSKRSSAGSSLGGRRPSALSGGSARGQASFDEDERLVDNILEGTAERDEVAGDSNMDFFLKDEDDEDDDEDDEDEGDEADAANKDGAK
ncbi:Rho-GTPase-activating protein 8, partial [Coemansia spiralis]